jgi:hypothetical protein
MRPLRLVTSTSFAAAIFISCANAQVPTPNVPSLPNQGAPGIHSGEGSSISQGNYGPGASGPGNIGPGSAGPGAYNPGNVRGAYIGRPIGAAETAGAGGRP